MERIQEISRTKHAAWDHLRTDTHTTPQFPQLRPS